MAVIDQLDVDVRVSFWISICPMPICRVPVPHCLSYRTFKINLDIKSISFPTLLLSKVIWAILGLLYSQINNTAGRFCMHTRMHTHTHTHTHPVDVQTKPGVSNGVELNPWVTWEELNLPVYKHVTPLNLVASVYILLTLFYSFLCTELGQLFFHFQIFDCFDIIVNYNTLFLFIFFLFALSNRNINDF